jgi:hypothetical protein
MRVHSRRWFCDTPNCSRKIFAERFEGTLVRYARRTNGTTELLQNGCSGGLRFERRLGSVDPAEVLKKALSPRQTAYSDGTERWPRPG